MGSWTTGAPDRVSGRPVSAGGSMLNEILDVRAIARSAHEQASASVAAAANGGRPWSPNFRPGSPNFRGSGSSWRPRDPRVAVAPSPNRSGSSWRPASSAGGDEESWDVRQRLLLSADPPTGLGIRTDNSTRLRLRIGVKVETVKIWLCHPVALAPMETWHFLEQCRRREVREHRNLIQALLKSAHHSGKLTAEVRQVLGAEKLKNYLQPLLGGGKEEPEFNIGRELSGVSVTSIAKSDGISPLDQDNEDVKMMRSLKKARETRAQMELALLEDRKQVLATRDKELHQDYFQAALTNAADLLTDDDYPDDVTELSC